MMKIINLYLLLAALLLSQGCAVTTKPELTQDGYFRMAAQPVEVKPPTECLPELSTTEHGNSVDFHLGAGYWKPFGIFALQVYPLSQSIHDAESFFQETEKFAPEYIANDRSSMGLNFKFFEGKPLQWEYPAYQAIGKTKDATFVAIFALHDTRITVASLVYPVDEQSQRDFPWECYLTFARSVKELQ